MQGVQLLQPIPERLQHVLSDQALAFATELERAFGMRRRELLVKRIERQALLDAGERPDFLPSRLDSG